MTTLLESLAFRDALWLMWALPVLAVLVLTGLLMRWIAWRRLGTVPRPVTRLWLRGLLIAGGLVLIGIAAMGPRWGREKTTVAGAVRDLVVVLDVSRSMLAETPSRQVRAQRILADFGATLKERGGHRIALVVFAAKARLVIPLTTDYDMFRAAVLDQDAARLLPELRPGKDGQASGTRLGEGLKEAVAAHEKAADFRGSQVILLVSDGDDPAGDEEWKDGAQAAQRAGMPVFVVGVGDPGKPSTIRAGENALSYEGRPIETALHENVLKEVAQRTDGVYYPVRTENTAPGSLVRAVLDSAAAHPRASPQVEDDWPRFRWFLAAGLALVVLSLCVVGNQSEQKHQTSIGGWWVADGGQWSQRSEAKGSEKISATNGKNKLVGAALGFFAVLLIAAANQYEDVFRLGNEAFQNKDYAAALKHYEQAEEKASDPGLVAFNKAAALMRLGRWREAELSYRRCLQDEAVPGERRLNARHNLGIVLLWRGVEGKDLNALFRAEEFFGLCLHDPIAPGQMRADAAHNLELAKLLLQKISAELEAMGKKGLPKTVGGGGKSPAPKDGQVGGDPTQKPSGTDKSTGGKSGEFPKDVEEHLPGAGNIQTLPDTDQLQGLDMADARDFLARVIQRIQRDREQALQQTTPISGAVKDW